MHVHLDVPGQVLGVAAYNPRSELVEALVQELRVLVEPLGRVDQVAGIEVNGETRDGPRP